MGAHRRGRPRREPGRGARRDPARRGSGGELPRAQRQRRPGVRARRASVRRCRNQGRSTGPPRRSTRRSHHRRHSTSRCSRAACCTIGRRSRCSAATTRGGRATSPSARAGTRRRQPARRGARAPPARGWRTGISATSTAPARRACTRWSCGARSATMSRPPTRASRSGRHRGDARRHRLSRNAIYEDALRVVQSVGDRRCTASTHKNLGLIATRRGDHACSVGLLDRSDRPPGTSSATTPVSPSASRRSPGVSRRDGCGRGRGRAARRRATPPRPHRIGAGAAPGRRSDLARQRCCRASWAPPRFGPRTRRARRSVSTKRSSTHWRVRSSGRQSLACVIHQSPLPDVEIPEVLLTEFVLAPGGRPRRQAGAHRRPVRPRAHLRASSTGGAPARGRARRRAASARATCSRSWRRTCPSTRSCSTAWRMAGGIDHDDQPELHRARGSSPAHRRGAAHPRHGRRRSCRLATAAAEGHAGRGDLRARRRDDAPTVHGAVRRSARRAGARRPRRDGRAPLLVGHDRAFEGRRADAPQPRREHRADARAHRAPRGRVVIAVLPFFHIYGMQVIMNTTLAAGANDRHDAALRPRAVPATARGARDHAVASSRRRSRSRSPSSRWSTGYDLSTLEQIFSGAAPLSAELAAEVSARHRLRGGAGLRHDRALAGLAHHADGPVQARARSASPRPTPRR